MESKKNPSEQHIAPVSGSNKRLPEELITVPEKHCRCHCSFDECFYHSPCADGVAAAYIVSKYARVDKFTPLIAGKDPEYIKETFPRGKSFIYVDLCPSEEHLAALLEHKNKILIIDHHTSAFVHVKSHQTNENLALYLSERRSGCGLTWEFFTMENTTDLFCSSMPELLLCIEDRDLWANDVCNSKEVMAEFFVLFPNCTIDEMESAINMFSSKRRAWIDAGSLMLQRRELTIDAICRKAVNCIESITGKKYMVKCVECSHEYVSDVGNMLANYSDFAVLWKEIAPGAYKISMRSNDKSIIDLSEIARKWEGGGGHKHAAGFTLLNIHPLRVFAPVRLPPVE